MFGKISSKFYNQNIFQRFINEISAQTFVFRVQGDLSFDFYNQSYNLLIAHLAALTPDAEA